MLDFLTGNIVLLKTVYPNNQVLNLDMSKHAKSHGRSSGIGNEHPKNEEPPSGRMRNQIYTFLQTKLLQMSAITLRTAL